MDLESSDDDDVFTFSMPRASRYNNETTPESTNEIADNEHHTRNIDQSIAKEMRQNEALEELLSSNTEPFRCDDVDFDMYLQDADSYYIDDDYFMNFLNDSINEGGEHQNNDEAGEHQNNDEAGEPQYNDETGEHQNNYEAGEPQYNDETGEHQNNYEAGEPQYNDEAGEHQNNYEAGEPQYNDETGEHQNNYEAGEPQYNDEAGEHQNNCEAGEPQNNPDNQGLDQPQQIGTINYVVEFNIILKPIEAPPP